MNAKKEFLEHIEGREDKLVCAKIGVDRNNYGSNIKWSILKSPEYLDTFLKEIDYEYDNGFGSQELFGQILFTDSFSDRYEYDGSESWQNHKMPTVDEVIKTN